MGTQSSYGGPRDTTPLLPAWAVAQPGAGVIPASQLPTPPATVVAPTAEPPGLIPVIAPPAVNPETFAPPNLAPVPLPQGSWKSARRSFTRALSSRSSGGYRNAARAYVRAARGSGRAAGGSVAGKRTASAFGGFLSAASGRGLDAAFAGIGLTAVAGRDVDEVLAAIGNAIAPDGATKEEVAARQALNDTLEHLYERFLDEGRDLTALEAMSREDIAAAMAFYVEAYVYNRWLGDLGVKIEERAVSASEAVALEREMRQFIHETVALDMQGVNPLTLDWGGQAGRQFIDNIYRDAYSLFGGEA